MLERKQIVGRILATFENAIYCFLNELLENVGDESSRDKFVEFTKNYVYLIAVLLHSIQYWTVGVAKSSSKQEKEVLNFNIYGIRLYLLHLMRLLERFLIVIVRYFIHELVLFAVWQDILSKRIRTFTIIMSFLMNPSLKFEIIRVFKSMNLLLMKLRATS